MTAAAPTERELDLRMLRDAASHLGTQSVKDGSWFQKLVAGHVRKHETLVGPATWDALYPGIGLEERAERHITTTARKAAAAGALASVGASVGELLSLVTEGLAAPVGVPAAAASMVLEAAYTSLLQVDLACDLASMYGVPFDPDDMGELATLFAIAFEVDVEPKAERGAEPEPAAGLEERLMSLEEGEVATRIGRKLLEEAVMRNVLPIVNVAVSARWNHTATRHFGERVKRYVRYRAAIEAATKCLHCESIGDPALVVEGAWLLATCDGRASHEEILAIALLKETLSPGAPIAIDEARLEDEDGWLARLGAAPASSHDAILDALYLVAGTDKALEPPERRLLRRIGKATGREIDFARVEAIGRHLAEGEAQPGDFGGAAPAMA